MRGPVDTVMRWWKAGRNHDGEDGDAAGACSDAQAPGHHNGNGGNGQRASARTADHAARPAAAREPAWYGQYAAAGIPRSLIYPTTTLGRMLDQTAERFGDTTAIIYNDRTWTYAELRAEANRLAGGLSRLGVRRNDRVILALPNCPEYVISFFAIQKLGAVVVNAGPLMGLDDLQHLIALTSPRVVIGLDLRARTLIAAGAGSTVEHWVWVTLQSYQGLLKRLGYQFKLWQESGGPEDTKTPGCEHITLARLLADAPARPPTLEPSPLATAVMQPTSGTTGTLKLVQLSHRNLLANAMQVSILMQARAGQERVLAVLPMFHVYGLMLSLVSAVFNAASMILMARFVASETIELLRRHKPTVFPIVPAICEAISNELEKQAGTEGRRLKDETRRDGSALHPSSTILHPLLCISGAAPLTQAVAERFERLTGSRVIEGYGLSEASPVTHANLPGRCRYGSIGIPLPDTRCRVADPDDPNRDVPLGEAGELLIAGPQIMSGYFANPHETSAALFKDSEGVTWLRSGDIVRMDADGYFHVIDRKKDMIIRSGLKVYPAKVERVLARHPGIADAAVIGRPDPVHTEVVTAVIVPKEAEADREALIEQLKALCREHLAPYEVPMRFEFVGSIPRSLLGKALKKELRKRPSPPQADAKHDQNQPVAVPENR
ncbi:AMP-binding protein [Fontivita pretiosa]|uniref:AMP-binding protein n=1 Tax=Fontivita pretiosa TaxID=2989684 RepID=UPI003D16C8E1